MLLERDFGAAVLKLLLDRLRLILGDVLLHGLRSALDQVLGFLEAKAGDLADDLDDIDLFGGVEALENVLAGADPDLARPVVANAGSNSGARPLGRFSG